MEYQSIEQGMAGKVAMITGGTRGIGKACVQVFCAAGVNVATIGRSVDQGDALVAEINAKGKGRCVYYPCDVKDTSRLKEIVELAVKEFGRLDVLVNCAGVFPAQSPIDAITQEMYMDVVQTNFTPYYMGCKFALPHLRKTKGSIVNIGSVVATQGGAQCQADLRHQGCDRGFYKVAGDR